MDVLQIRILSKSTGQTTEKLERDISRPKYFNPYEAIEYGIIDKVEYSLASRARYEMKILTG